MILHDNLTQKYIRNFKNLGCRPVELVTLIVMAQDNLAGL